MHTEDYHLSKLFEHHQNLLNDCHQTMVVMYKCKKSGIMVVAGGKNVKKRLEYLVENDISYPVILPYLCLHHLSLLQVRWLHFPHLTYLLVKLRLHHLPLLHFPQLLFVSHPIHYPTQQPCSLACLEPGVRDHTPTAQGVYKLTA